MAEGRVCPVCRLTPLSRYNSEALCGACLQAARGASRTAPSWLWDSAPMRRALANVDLSACVAIVRGASGLSQLELANLVGWGSQSVVSRIESGHRDTLYDIRELLRFADAIDMPRDALMPLIMGDPTATGDALVEVRTETVPERPEQMDTEQMDVDRRHFSGLVVGGMLGLGLDRIRVPDQVGLAHVNYLRTCADRLYRTDQSVGGAALLRQAIRQFYRARRMVNESDYTTMVGEELLVIAGDLAVCAGWLAFDGGNLGVARQMYGEALILARAAKDTELTVHVLTNMSMLASYVARTIGPRGMAREGLRMANCAADEARHAPSPRLHALVALRQANAAGLLGDEATFRGAITHARRELDRGPHDDDSEWILFVSAAEITGHEAMGRLNLGDPAKAENLYRSVLDDSSLSPRNRAGYGALLAGALLQKGDRSHAIDVGLGVLPALAGGVTSIRTLNELRSVRAAAGSTEEEFCARFDAVTTALAA